MRPPHYAFYVLADELTADQAREIVHGLGLDETWLRVVETTARYEDRSLLQVEPYDLESGEPVFADELGPSLAADGRTALAVGSFPEESEVAFALYEDGDVSFMWAGQLDDFEAEEEDGSEHRGKEGFEHVFTDLTGAPFESFLDAPSVKPEAKDTADEETLLLLRGRFVGLPPGFERIPELHFFHEADLEPDAGDDDGDRMAIVLLDLRLAEELWNNQPAGAVAAFLEAIAPLRERVLGPLAGAVAEVQQFVLEQDPSRPLAEASDPPLIAYELLAMATAVAYVGGHRVTHFDERFFPLLAPQDGGDLERVIGDELDDISGMGLLSAMCEVLPYSVPEGDLLESFADEELSPLAPWAIEGESYEGSIVLLDASRLIEAFGAFRFADFDARCERFAAAWAALASDGAADAEAWREARAELDAEERAELELLHGELASVLALSMVNHLQPAIFFYGQ